MEVYRMFSYDGLKTVLEIRFEWDPIFKHFHLLDTKP